MISNGYNPNNGYFMSFKSMPDKTTYYDPNMGLDLRDARGKEISADLKALGPETGGAGTAGYALVPVYVDSRIVDLSRKYTPFVEMIPRVTNYGLTADYNVITSKGSAFAGPADAPLAESDDDYDRKSEPIKFLYSVGRVLGPMQSAMPGYSIEGIDSTGSGMGTGSPFETRTAQSAHQTNVLLKARALKELEENLMLNGDKTANAHEFDGIVKILDGVNEKDMSGSVFEWTDLEQAAERAMNNGGRPKVLIGSLGVIRRIRELAIQYFRVIPGNDESAKLGIPGSFTIDLMNGPVRVVPSMFLNNTDGNRSLYLLDTDFIEMRVLQDMTYEELAKTNDSKKFMLKVYETLIVRAPQFNSSIVGIGDTSA